jgi:hypothetical protein
MIADWPDQLKDSPYWSDPKSLLSFYGSTPYGVEWSKIGWLAGLLACASSYRVRCPYRRRIAHPLRETELGWDASHAALQPHARVKDGGETMIPH